MQCFRLLILVLILNFPITTFAQEDNVEDIIPKWWVNLGTGTGSSFGSDGINIQDGLAAHLSFNGAFTQHVFSTFYLNGLKRSSPKRNILDVGLLLGYVNKKPKNCWSVSSGIAHYHRENHSPNSYPYSYKYQYSQSKNNIALPIQVQRFWTPFKHFGLGVVVHWVVVPEPYATGLLTIQFQG